MPRIANPGVMPLIDDPRGNFWAPNPQDGGSPMGLWQRAVPSANDAAMVMPGPAVGSNMPVGGGFAPGSPYAELARLLAGR